MTRISLPSLASVSLAAGVALAGLLAAPAAQAQATQVGTLSCSVAPGAGFVIGSRKDVTCTFQNVGAELEIYDGTITKVGLDIGFTSGAVIVWNVVTTGRIGRGSLAGAYVGGTAEASFAAGLGANVLVGGSNNTIALQPLSVSAQSGINIAAGAAEMVLRYRVPPQRQRRRG